MAPFVAVVDSEQVRAAVTVALDASMDAMVDEITRRVLAALRYGKPSRDRSPDRGAQLAEPEAEPRVSRRGWLRPRRARHGSAATDAPTPPVSPATPVEPVRRVTPLRIRSGSILGLESAAPSRPAQAPDIN